MFSLSFVGGPNPRRGSKSASVFGPGGSISASGFGPGGPYLLADLDRGVQIRWDTGPGEDYEETRRADGAKDLCRSYGGQ